LEGHYYLVLDFIDGPSLAQELERTGPLSRQSAARIGFEVLEALAAAHARNLVHQDLKPSNVMLDQVGSAHVTDFGLVTFRGTQTTEGSICGTPAYMSPEQWTNRALDGRSDLYAWGVMMFEMLSGELPLFAGSIKEFARLAVEQAPLSLTARAPRVPDGLARLIHECLAKQPLERPNSALVVAERLREWHDQPAVPCSRREWTTKVDQKSDVEERSPQNEVSSMPNEASACTITLPSKGS
jgi:serine/threonine protein kinase